MQDSAGASSRKVGPCFPGKSLHINPAKDELNEKHRPHQAGAKKQANTATHQPTLVQAEAQARYASLVYMPKKSHHHQPQQRPMHVHKSDQRQKEGQSLNRPQSAIFDKESCPWFGWRTRRLSHRSHFFSLKYPFSKSLEEAPTFALCSQHNLACEWLSTPLPSECVAPNTRSI